MKRIAIVMLLGFAMVLLNRLSPIGFHGQQAIACDDGGGERDGGGDDSNG
jgi:hypothetical protein